MLLPCGQKGGGFGAPESHPPFSLLLSGESVSSATVRSNKPALPTGRVSCLEAPLPNNFEEKEKRSILWLPSFSLLYHLSIRSLLCAQLANLTECLSFRARVAKVTLFALLFSGAVTNEALFFLKESIMKLCGGTIQVR